MKVPLYSFCKTCKFYRHIGIGYCTSTIHSVYDTKDPYINCPYYYPIIDETPEIEENIT